MGTITLSTPLDFRRELAAQDDAQLMAQDLAQQGAIHALSYLLQHGGGEEALLSMLASLRENAKLIREEAKRRGKRSLFEQDQTGFN